MSRYALCSRAGFVWTNKQKVNEESSSICKKCPGKTCKGRSGKAFAMNNDYLWINTSLDQENQVWTCNRGTSPHLSKSTLSGYKDYKWNITVSDHDNQVWSCIRSTSKMSNQHEKPFLWTNTFSDHDNKVWSCTRITSQSTQKSQRNCYENAYCTHTLTVNNNSMWPCCRGSSQKRSSHTSGNKDFSWTNTISDHDNQVWTCNRGTSPKSNRSSNNASYVWSNTRKSSEISSRRCSRDSCKKRSDYFASAKKDFTTYNTHVSGCVISTSSKRCKNKFSEEGNFVWTNTLKYEQNSNLPCNRNTYRSKSNYSSSSKNDYVWKNTISDHDNQVWTCTRGTSPKRSNIKLSDDKEYEWVNTLKDNMNSVWTCKRGSKYSLSGKSEKSCRSCRKDYAWTNTLSDHDNQVWSCTRASSPKRLRNTFSAGDDTASKKSQRNKDILKCDWPCNKNSKKSDSSLSAKKSFVWTKTVSDKDSSVWSCSRGPSDTAVSCNKSSVKTVCASSQGSKTVPASWEEDCPLNVMSKLSSVDTEFCCPKLKTITSREFVETNEAFMKDCKSPCKIITIQRSEQNKTPISEVGTLWPPCNPVISAPTANSSFSCPNLSGKTGHPKHTSASACSCTIKIYVDSEHCKSDRQKFDNASDKDSSCQNATSKSKHHRTSHAVDESENELEIYICRYCGTISTGDCCSTNKSIKISNTGIKRERDSCGTISQESDSDLQGHDNVSSSQNIQWQALSLAKNDMKACTNEPSDMKKHKCPCKSESLISNPRMSTVKGCPSFYEDQYSFFKI